MSSRPEPFWLCHECGAQMRPLRIDGAPHCASCNGEFLEILDSDVNPDPFHELPPAPPVRPRSANPSPPRPPNQRPNLPQDPSQGGGGFMQSLFSNIFGAGGDDASDSPGAGSPNQRPTSSPHFGNLGQGGGGGRSFTFQVGNGEGRVFFGSSNAAQVNPFGPFGFPFGPQGGQGGPFGLPGQGSGRGMAGEQGGLEGFFPGFPEPGMSQQRNGRSGQGLRPGQPVDPGDLMRGLMEMLHQDGIIQMGPGGQGGPNMIFIGPQGRMNMGDYATSETGFNAILEQLMHAAGPQGPLPATEAVIDGLPRIQFTEESLEKSLYKDCPVCKEDFTVGDEVMKIPCGHVCHPDCLQPWLKINGSCPVCRFSLLPNEENRAPPSGPSDMNASAPTAPSAQSVPASPAQQQPSHQEQGGQSTITNILNRLWGQAGSTSGQTSPTTEMRSPSVPPTQPGQTSETSNPYEETLSASSGGRHTQETSEPATQQGSGVQNPPQTPPNLSSAIPDDYRERHRRREQQEHRNPPVDDLD